MIALLKRRAFKSEAECRVLHVPWSRCFDGVMRVKSAFTFSWQCGHEVSNPFVRQILAHALIRKQIRGLLHAVLRAANSWITTCRVTGS